MRIRSVGRAPLSWLRALASVVLMTALLATVSLVAPVRSALASEMPTFRVDQSTNADYRIWLNVIGAYFADRLIPDSDIGMTEYGSAEIFAIEVAHGGESIHLVFSRDDLYLVGYYRPSDGVYSYFNDRNNRSNAYRPPGLLASYEMSYGGSYKDLQRVAGVQRKNLRLGRAPLGAAIDILSEGSTTPDDEEARALLLVIQMLAEAARFTPIAQAVAASWNTPAPLGADLIAIQVNWTELSRLAYHGTVALSDENDMVPQDYGGVDPFTVGTLRFDSQRDAQDVLTIARGCDDMPPEGLTASRSETVEGDPADCAFTPNTYAVTVKSVTFANPGDAGGDPEPYGYLDVSYGYTPADPKRTHQWSRFWSVDADSTETVGAATINYDHIFTGISGQVCFSGWVYDQDSSGADDRLTPEWELPNPEEECGVDGTWTLWGPEGTVTIDYEVNQIFDCTNQTVYSQCVDYHRDFYVVTNQISFTQPGDAGEGPEPYGAITLEEPGATTTAGDTVWSVDPDDARELEYYTQVYVEKIEFGERPQTSAPCLKFDVKDEDGAGNADDQIAGPGVACGKNGKLIIGTAVGRVSLIYQLFRILVSHDEL
ncbi:ribosome-inactivating family protein [Micromonospora rifamycinica]|uniref:Ribosome inactivating protein n=1 Tax=Micromonospora rifamycinica TaxID=291594 RepID=A0A1C5H0I6_9ACTN|nr:ribosome-inactivating family protein [Micromonospora rifamycinica]SCG39579.1 Ribosome inactivating protein [Micromonospora rifamycinica]